MFVHLDGRPHGLRGDPFKASVVPRPIGWISSMNADGQLNLAPFSFFNAVSEEPWLVMYCANGGHADGGEKDSVTNVRATGEFVVNLATWALREAVNASSAHLPRGESEFQHAGVATAPSTLVRPPRVAASPIALECRLERIIELPDPDDGSAGLNRMVLGRVLGMYIDDAVIADGRIDPRRLKAIARLGYKQYALIDSVFEMTRQSE